MVPEGDVDSTTMLEHGRHGAGRGAPQPLGPLLFRLLSADDLSQPSARYPLAPFAEVEIGRSGLSGEQPRPTALRVDVRDPFASSHHAHLERRDGGWRVRDQDSRKGTLVNGERAPAREDVPLADGDLIEIGHTFFLFRASARGVSESTPGPLPDGDDPLTLNPEWELELVKAARLSRTSHEILIEGAAADVELSEKHPELAIARLNKALAARVPEVPHRFDAELLLARALSAAGRTREAQSRLRAIVAEARQKGFVLVEKAALEKR